MNPSPGKALDARLADARLDLAAGIEHGRSPSGLLSMHTRAHDSILREAWRRQLPGRAIALYATGGYGRRALYPGSDIDLAVLLETTPPESLRIRIERFIRNLWDLGLRVGISVRTLEETGRAAAADITIFTALSESRRLAGDARLDARLFALLADPDLWPAPIYLDAKRQERARRYARFDGSSQRLEPSVKESPGGLRDLMTIFWIAARFLGQRKADLRDLASQGLITIAEQRELAAALRVIARIRLGLHHLANRAEDRLLFDLQPRLAALLGYRPRRGTLPVERMMQDYYRSAGFIARTNALMFLILGDQSAAPARPLAPGLIRRGKYIDFALPESPRITPRLVFDIFRHWQDTPSVHGLAPSAQRAIATALPRIDAAFRADRANMARFLAILRTPSRVHEVLLALHETGVLSRYLPAFARITGRMQYDLYHLFTVDEHVLWVIANIQALREGQFTPARTDLLAAAARIDRIDLLYLAALFHDIAKGRGGNHSHLGAAEARRFTRAHGFSPAERDLVVWLVREHLTLSLTAQKSDLSDPRVIADFAARVGDQRRLDYLYILTVADVRATNPSLWNAWRGALFGELYETASQALWRGLEHPADTAGEIAIRKRDARNLLGGRSAVIERLWNRLGEEYFLQYPAEEIVWHTRNLMTIIHPPAVFLRPAPNRSGTAIMVYCSRGHFAFARMTAALAQLGLTIVAARCVPVGRDITLDTYMVLEADGCPIEDLRQLERVKDFLTGELERDPTSSRRVTRPTPRQVRLFSTPTRITMTADTAHRYTLLELHASDRPGLLATVGRAFRRCGVYLLLAKVMTVGERAEDVFHITDDAGKIPDEATLLELEKTLYAEINENT